MTTIPSSCRAAMLVAPREPVEVREVQVPDRVEPGALLVKTLAATVCATDVHTWEGDMVGRGAPLPMIMGHEMMGRVVAMGDHGAYPEDSVGQDLSIGDRVIWAYRFCGQCVSCVIERSPTQCEHRARFANVPHTEYPYLSGGWSEYCYVYPQSGRVKVPDEVSDVVAAASACALRTVVHAFDRLGRIDDRHSVVVQGSGPLGLFSTAKAVAAGVTNVVVIGGPRARLQLARQWGATATIDIEEVPDPADRRQLVMDATRGRGADVVVEASGVSPAFNEGMNLLGMGGRYMVIGQVSGRSVEFNPTLLITKNAHLMGTKGGAIEHYYRGLEFLRHHGDRFQWDDMISSRFPLRDVNEALAGMKTWREIKPALQFA